MTKLDLYLNPQLGLAFQPTTDTVMTAELLSMPDSVLADRLVDEAARNPALIVEVREPSLAARPPLRGRWLDRAVSAGHDELSARADHEHPALRLVADAAPMLSAEDRPLALEIAFGLDRRGFLGSEIDELARTLDVASERVRRIVEALQASGPEGIATAGPRECLVVQLRALEPPPAWRDLAVLLVEHTLEDLARGRLDCAAQQLGVTRTEVEEALAGMRRHVRPYPDWDPPGSYAPPAQADVVADLHEGQVIARLADEYGLRVRVDERLRCDDPRLARAAREADAWVCRVSRCRSAVLAVAQASVARQERAMRLGLSQLRPLTRREVGRVTGLHESTVSRVVSERVLRTPYGRLVPFAALFGSALDAVSVLGQLIAEAPAPRCDQALAEAMAAAGHPIARRTVAKYRAKLGIPRVTRVA
jgi:RNA polymerase sigma-54 factor